MTGKVLVVFLCLIATLFSVGAASHTGLMTWISLAASSTAFVAMALNQFLATRPRFLEPLFGGLDRIYHFHRQIGIAALVLILIHYFVTPDFQGKQLTAGLNLLAKEAGKYGFYGLIALIALSLVKRIPYTKLEVPYGLWRQSHRLMGVFSCSSPFTSSSSSDLLTALRCSPITSTCLLSLAWEASPILVDGVPQRRSYTVTSVEKHAAAGSSKQSQFAGRSRQSLVSLPLHFQAGIA
ncbi:MAG: ferric reductase-like transmembrane domain-containing protein [Nitratireductor sp.]